MHEACSGSFQDGKAVVDKIRMMGFNKNALPNEIIIKCSNCGSDFQMTHLESKCPTCNMVYGVTPCSVNKPERIMPAGIDY